VPPPAQTPERSRHLLNGALAAALVGAGALLAWLQPWQARPPAAPDIADSARVAAASPAAVPQPTDPTQPQAPASEPATELQSAGPAAQLPPMPDARVEAAGALPSPPEGGVEDAGGESSRNATATDASAARGGRDVPLLNDLPAAVRQEIPAISIAFHAYSGNARERRIMINGDMAQEGEALGGGLSVEEITRDGVILGYKGYRFRQALR